MSNYTYENNRYTVKAFSNQNLFNSVSGLSFDEAYKKAVPEEALPRYPGNYWHVKMKYAVLEDIVNKDSSLVSYFQNPNTNVVSIHIYIYKD